MCEIKDDLISKAKTAWFILTAFGCLSDQRKLGTSSLLADYMPEKV